ncbi:DUF1080 domain-containing protein [Verrucomicrobiaceae bacterium R5-34]|nr:DUF1080 domain-containing protein [Verrucomicrobiaceae bacterium R5-34]
MNITTLSKPLLLTLALSTLPCHAKDPEAAKQAAESPQAGAVSLFDGRTLDGWKLVNPKHGPYWSVQNGAITASNGDQKMPTNTFLATTKEYGDFEFTCDFRLSGDHATGLINSGIQYRSLLKNHKKRGMGISGYQADIGKDWWGGIYDEHRRGKLVKGNEAALRASEGFKDDNWHRYKIVCKGNQHKLYINGILTAEYTEKNPKIPAQGVIALQLHRGGVAKIEYKNIFIKEL